jgi:hypothetical protein
MLVTEVYLPDVPAAHRKDGANAVSMNLEAWRQRKSMPEMNFEFFAFVDGR